MQKMDGTCSAPGEPIPRARDPLLEFANRVRLTFGEKIVLRRRADIQAFGEFDGIVFRHGESQIGEADPPVKRQLLVLFQLLVHLCKGVHREVQVFSRMRRGNLRADAGRSVGDNRIEETDHVNAFL